MEQVTGEGKDLVKSLGAHGYGVLSAGVVLSAPVVSGSHVVPEGKTVDLLASEGE